MARTITRKELLKGGIAGAAAIAAAPLASSSAFASREAGDVFVHIHALVKNPNPSVGSSNINIDVAGRRKPDGSLPALSGTGWDSDNPDAIDQNSFCLFGQRGRLEGSKVKLHGQVFIFNDPANKGAAVTTTANLDTGEVIWTFAGFVFTGKGIVVKSED